MNKPILTFVAAMVLTITITAQVATYQFTPVHQIKVGDTEDQCSSGTCWSFATISFLEAEIIRKGNKPIDLSEMFNVHHTYQKKAESYVRYQGKQQFGPGGLSHDVIHIVKEFGLVPESAYAGLTFNEVRHNHDGLDNLLESTVNTVLKKNLNANNQNWKKSVTSILDANLGAMPTTFTYEGKEYNPITFRDAMKINASDYVSITSFSHHPFNESFVLEVPDNWAKGSFYNVTLDDMMSITDNALAKGYSIAWDADVSERGFDFGQGMALLPEANVTKDELFKKVITEQQVTQANRQAGFDSFETTDDHLMHLTGMAKDQNGQLYYTIKNSWGTKNPYNGYQYISKAYYQMKTVGIVVHKDAIPTEIRKKLGL
jgi:bleomycin hydrolase